MIREEKVCEIEFACHLRNLNPLKNMTYTVNDFKLISDIEMDKEEVNIPSFQEDRKDQTKAAQDDKQL